MQLRTVLLGVLFLLCLAATSLARPLLIPTFHTDTTSNSGSSSSNSDIQQLQHAVSITFAASKTLHASFDKRDVFVSLWNDKEDGSSAQAEEFTEEPYLLTLASRDAGTYMWKAVVVDTVSLDVGRDQIKTKEQRFAFQGQFHMDASGVVTEDTEVQDNEQHVQHTSRTHAAAPSPVAGGGRTHSRTKRDQVILDDLIVGGSACIGQDCVNGEAFGLDTIRLKENNLRIRFQDTSSSASFPSNDWVLEANDSSNGGSNAFTITNVDGGKSPFRVMSTANTYTAYLDDAGVGIHTDDVRTDLHIFSGDSPSIYLEQDAPSQVWEMYGNDAQWAVRDVSNSRQQVLRLQAGAPQDSLYVSAVGDVGIGNSAPMSRLHITSQAAAPAQVTHENSMGTWQSGVNAAGIFEIVCPGCGGSGQGMRVTTDGDVDATGVITGQVAFLSDKNAKTDFESVDHFTILDKVAALDITSWEYKTKPGVRHVGPMAQDFHAAFGLGDRDTRINVADASGVALSAIQALYSTVTEMKDTIAELRKEVTMLKKQQQ